MVYMGQVKSDIVTEEKILSYFKDNSRELYKIYVESKLINQEVDQEIVELVGLSKWHLLLTALLYPE